LIRNQPCLLMRPGGPGGIVFREHFVSMTDLKKRIAPDVNLFSSPWLFQYLTETLDKRVLAVLGNRDIEGMTSPVSLNLNVGTILSRDFQKFHSVVGKGTKNVVVEIQVIDIFADMGTYGYARDSLQERGYRVVVDGLTPLALQFIDPGLLKSDFIKINWGSEFEGEIGPARTAQMRDVVSAMGKDSVILSRVDTEAAMKWGFGLGISRFQGFFVDDMVAKLSNIKVQQVKAKAKPAAAAPAAVARPEPPRASPGTPPAPPPGTLKA
jgi:hypothetical protein